LESLETGLHQDLNGDGVIGVPGAVTIESAGSTNLVEIGNNYYLDNNISGLGPELKFGNGAPYAAGQAGTWSPIGAEQTSTGYEVAWKAAGADQYSAWSTDGNGTYISNIMGVVSGTSAALESLEPSFHQDLNGDGVIGIPARTSPAGANPSSINPASSTQIPGGDGISALDLAHYLSGQASERWHFDFSSPSGSGGIPELEGSFPGIADNKLLTALMSHPQAGQPFQPADGGHEPPGYHDGMTVGNAALADLHAGYFIFS